MQGETMVTPQKSGQISYSALANLALDAVVELENFLHRRTKALADTRKLFGQLHNVPDFSVTSAQAVKHASPTALAVYVRALPVGTWRRGSQW